MYHWTTKWIRFTKTKSVKKRKKSQPFDWRENTTCSVSCCCCFVLSCLALFCFVRCCFVCKSLQCSSWTHSKNNNTCMYIQDPAKEKLLPSFSKPTMSMYTYIYKYFFAIIIEYIIVCVKLSRPVKMIILFSLSYSPFFFTIMALIICIKITQKPIKSAHIFIYAIRSKITHRSPINVIHTKFWKFEMLLHTHTKRSLFGDHSLLRLLYEIQSLHYFFFLVSSN